MAISTKHTLGCVSFGATNIFGIRDHNPDPGFEQFIEYAAGEVRPSLRAVKTYSPVADFTTIQISTLLGAVPISTGLDIPTATATNDFYFQQMQNKGARKTGANHRRIRIVTGFALIDSINFGLTEIGTAKCRTVAIYDGTNLPFVHAGSVSLPATPVNTEAFVFYGAFLNTGSSPTIGQRMAGGQGCTIDMNNQLDIEFADADLYPTWASFMSQAPQVTIPTKELPLLDTYAVAVAATSASVLYFQKVDPFKTRVAPGTAAHIKVVIPANLHMIQAMGISSAQGRSSDTSIMIYPATDGTNLPLVVTTGETLPS